MPDNNMSQELISLYQCDNSLMNNAIDRLLLKLYIYKKQHQKNTFLLTGCSPGSGTTMIAVNLAIALAGAGCSTLLVDTDMRKGAEYKRLNSNTAGMSAYLEGQTDMDSVICPTNRPKLHYVPFGVPNTNAVRLLCSERMQQFISGADDRFDFVVFDCPSLNAAADAAALFPYVDCIALVLSLGSTTKGQLAYAKRETSKYPDKYAGLIVNRVDSYQYKNMFPRYGYFEDGNLRKQHKRFLKKKEKHEEE